MLSTALFARRFALLHKKGTQVIGQLGCAYVIELNFVPLVLVLC
jgi:hypothetical protein